MCISGKLGSIQLLVENTKQALEEHTAFGIEHIVVLLTHYYISNHFRLVFWCNAREIWIQRKHTSLMHIADPVEIGTIKSPDVRMKQQRKMGSTSPVHLHIIQQIKAKGQGKLLILVPLLHFFQTLNLLVILTYAVDTPASPQIQRLQIRNRSENWAPEKLIDRLLILIFDVSIPIEKACCSTHNHIPLSFVYL